MIYFKKNDELIEKYQVSFDREEIEYLKQVIINKCSYIKHREYTNDYRPRFYNEIIRNLNITNAGEVKEYFEETREVYLISYDEYEPPYLVKLIDQLLKGNTSIIDLILNYDLSISTTSIIDKKIELLSEEFNKIPIYDINKKKMKMNELEELLKEKELNKNQQSIDLYYKQLIYLIKLDLVETLPVSELNKVETFFGTKLYDKNNTDGIKEDLVVKSLKVK